MVSRGGLRLTLAGGFLRGSARGGLLGRSWRALRWRRCLILPRLSRRRAEHAEHEDGGQSHTRSRIKCRGFSILRLRSAASYRFSCSSNWNMEAENSSGSVDRFEVDRAVVPLQNLIGLGQADAATVFLGGEIELENLVVEVLRNPTTLVADFGHHGVVFAASGDREQTSLGHGLHAIEHDVEDGLLHQINVDLNGQPLFRHMALDGDAMLLGVRGGELGDLFHQAAQVDLFQVEIAGAGEIDEGLHHAIQAADFAVDNVHVTASVGLLLGQFVAQQLQVEHDGVDGIFHLVGHAPGEAPAGGEAARHLNLVANAAHRLGIAHDQQRADLRIFFLHEVERNLDALASGSVKLARRQGTAALEGIEQSRAQQGIAVEYLVNRMSEKFGARTSQKTFHRRAYQHHARIAREQHQAILQLGHELIDIVFEGRENLPAVANLAAQVGNFQGDEAVLIMTGLVAGKRFCIARAHAIEIEADFLQRAQGQVGDSRGQKQGSKNQRDGNIARPHEPGLHLALQKDGLYADADRAKRFAAHFQRVGHVVNLSRAEDETKLIKETGAYDPLKIRTRGDHLAHHARIRMQQGLAADVNDRHVVNESPVAGIGLEQVVQSHISLNVIRKSAAHRGGVAGVDGCAAEVGYGVRYGVRQLVRQAVCRLVRTGDAQAKNLRDIQVGKRGNHHRHHESDGQHDYGLSSQHGEKRESDSPDKRARRS